MTDTPTAMITGASGGLGSAIATALAPTHTLFLAGRPSARLDEVAERLGATTWPLDLEDLDAIPAAVEPIVELDVLIHNAGVGLFGTLAESSINDWRTAFDVNVIGAVALTKAMLPALRRAGANIIFVNTTSGLNALPGRGAYSASKFALRAFADTLRAEEPALHVTSVFPGRIDTPMQQELVDFEGGTYDTSAYMRPETAARVIADTVNAPRDAHIHEVIVRPT